MSNINIQSVIENEYKDYAIYVLESRAIPSMIDGLKPSQRKALYTAVAKANSPVKTMSLIGSTISHANFHHGDASLGSAINLMAAPWANNRPLLHGIGSFGSKVAPEAASPRYTSVKLSKNFALYFNDNDILPTNDDPENPEPRFYLPLIPWVLVNGVRGIAVGFATEIQPRNPDDLTKACAKYIETGKLPKEIAPYYEGFKGSIEKNAAGEWICTGAFNWMGANKVEVTELPVGVSRSKYVAQLDKLEDAGKIASFKDYCDKSGFRFQIAFKRGARKTDKQIVRLLHLESKLNENLTVIDTHGRVKVYDNEIELIKDFCDYRLKTVETRIAHYIDRDSEALRYARVRKEFIDSVVSSKLSFKGMNRSRLEAWVMNNITNVVSDDVAKLTSIATYSFTTDEIQKLSGRITELQTAIKYWRSTTAKTEYLDDLSKL